MTGKNRRRLRSQRSYWLLKSATVPLGTPGRVQSTCLVVLLSWCLLFLFFKGTHIRYPLNSLDLFSSLFASFFGTSFLPKKCTKRSQNGAPKQPKITKICKNSSSKRTHSQDMQRDSVWNGSNHLNRSQFYTFTTFVRGPGLPKTSQNGPKMEPPGTPNLKNQEKRALRKTAKKQTEKSVLMSSKVTPKGTSFSYPECS